MNEAIKIVEKYISKIQILNTEHLKILAVITMLIDHIGMVLFPDSDGFRIIGRMAFPIFAYLIGEGCIYTKSKFKYLFKVFLSMTAYHLGTYILTKETNLCVLVAFAFAIIFTMIWDWAKKSLDKRFIVPVLYGLFVFVFSIVLKVDYYFFGFIIPIFVYLVRDNIKRYAIIIPTIFLLSFMFGGTQWYGLLTIIPILMYNGKKGNNFKIPKNTFYVFYPLHYIIILLINTFSS